MIAWVFALAIHVEKPAVAPTSQSSASKSEKITTARHIAIEPVTVKINPARLPPSPIYSANCKQIRSLEQASTCASIRQAKAAEDANATSAILNFSNIFIALISLFVAVMAVRTSNKALKSVERAFIYPGQLEEHVVHDEGGNVLGWNIYAPWENSGTTPALECKSGLNLLSFHINDEKTPHLETIKPWFPFDYENNFGTNTFYIGPKRPIKIGPLFIPLSFLWRLKSCTDYRIFIYGVIKYRDIFMRKHETRFCLQLMELIGNPADPENKPAARYADWTRFNTMDEQCAKEDKEIYALWTSEIAAFCATNGWKKRTGYG